MLLTAVTAFAATNIDDIFLLMLLFAQTRSRRDRLRITAGQYLGVGLLFAASLAGARAARALPPQVLPLLGLVPLALGVRELLEGLRRPANRSDDAPPPAPGVLSVALLTVSNGADNLGVYIPLFSGYAAPQLAAAGLVFAAMTALWCFLGCRLAGLPAVNRLLRRCRPVLVPAVLIFLGISILLE